MRGPEQQAGLAEAGGVPALRAICESFENARQFRFDGLRVETDAQTCTSDRATSHFWCPPWHEGTVRVLRQRVPIGRCQDRECDAN